MELDAANLFFVGTLALTGLVSTLAGVFTATRWQRRTGTGYAGVLAASGVASAPLAFAAFVTPDPFLCKVLLALSMFMLFLSTGPVNTLIIETVPVRMRATSMAASIFAIHMFGDLWSPMIVGRLADRMSDIRLAVLWSLPVALVVCAFFWCWLLLWVQRSRVTPASA